jgi:predicted alpha/beta hydrolase family esterase
MRLHRPSRALIIHGSYGSPDAYWLPWLRERLEEAGISTEVPHFPTPEGQDLKAWRRVFDDEIGEVGAEWMLFGHSLGVAFLLDVLERSNSAVAALFSVSGFAGLLDLELFDSVNRTFVDREFDWRQIGGCVEQSYVYQGDDDPYVPQKWGKYLAQKLDAERHVIPGGGHLNSVAAHEQLEIMWNDVESVCGV